MATLTRLAAIIAAGAVTAAAAAATPCDLDLDDDGNVGILDFLDLLGQWGTDPGRPPDFDGDGNVGILDFLELLAGWGPITFEYGPPLGAEPEQIGLEMLGAAGPLLVPPEVYDRIVRDLAAIRADEPSLADQFHSMAWLPNEMIVQIDETAPQDGYECLNLVYGVSNIDPLFSNWYVLTLGGKINVPALGAIYVSDEAVLFSEPNFLIGGQNFWVPEDLGSGFWRWEIDDGWHDCFDGCDCHRVYVYRTDEAGNVQLIDFQEFGQPWCDFGG